MRAQDLLRRAVAELASNGIPDAARDARRLVAHGIGVPADRLTLHLHDDLSDAQMAAVAEAVTARLRRQPVSQITGTRFFWGRPFRVTGDVLDPRPETEILVEAALARPFTRILDLGTGSGCILLSCLADRSTATGLGVDLSEAALAVARHNASTLGVSARAEFLCSDWCSEVTGLFDLIVSNPPYIAANEMPDLSPEVRDWEPHLALTPGGDGLDAYRAIAAQAPEHLCQGGVLMAEIGPTQGPAVSGLWQSAGLQSVAVLQDLDGRDRVVVGVKP